jgi:hypothetical protein
MSDCRRKGDFHPEEQHKCFLIGCTSLVFPARSDTCQVCNWKKCEEGHCGCDLIPEARFAVDTLYSTFCDYCKDSTPEQQGRFSLRNECLDHYYEGALWVIDQFIESTEDNPRKGIASDYWVLRFVEARNHLIQEAKENGIALEEDLTPEQEEVS